MLIQMWNNYRLSPTVIYVNAQEQKNITNKCLTDASGPLRRYNASVDAGQAQPSDFTASGVVRWYYNPLTGFEIPVDVHPDLPPGTILASCERLPVWYQPVWYQSNEVPNVAEVMTRRDYYRIDWPIVTRSREFGVYAEETLAVYAPFGVGILTNIATAEARPLLARRLHEILPVKAEALAFVIGGAQVFARRVEHPGSLIPERSYLRSSLDDMRDEIVAALAEAATETWERA